MTGSKNLTMININTTDLTDFSDLDRVIFDNLDINTMSVDEIVAWLYDHGAAHLSQIERIELAERLLTRRRFIIGAGGLIGAAALSSCGAGEEAIVPMATVAATRTVATPRGSVTIPAHPQRVAALYTHDLANALALGLPVIVGPGETGQLNAPFPPYLVELFDEQLDGVTALAYQPELNFEQLTALQPDVILSGIFGTFDPGFAQLEAIAPTVTYRYSEGAEYVLNPWQDVLRMNGTQFGREDVAEEWIARFADRAGDLRERLAPRWSGATYAVVSPRPDQLYLSGPTSGHVPRTLDELGLQLVDSIRELVAEADELNQGGVAVSFELLGELDADVLFVPVWAGADGTPERAGLDALTAQALWATLPAVRAGQVYEFTGDIWYESGPMALAFLDVVEQALLS